MVQAAERRSARTSDAPAGGTVTLSKHEGAGNDFLVLVDPDDAVVVTASGARALCDRRRGVGADGLIVCRRSPEADLAMILFNADGTEAEMSGNGIRCLAQAAIAAGVVRPVTFTVATAAGVRTVDYHDGPGHVTASVDMGRVTLAGEEPSPVPGGRARAADVGNPHLVVLVDADPSTVDLAVAAAGCAERYPGGVNLEVVQAGPGRDELRLRVWERGVGETLACGTGSCAAAAVARGWGMVGDRVAVHNPGGTLVVRLGATDAEPVVLAGPVRHVADVVVAMGALRGGAPDRVAPGEGR
jgi:diaminopimelate epimerase